MPASSSSSCSANSSSSSRSSSSGFICRFGVTGEIWECVSAQRQAAAHLQSLVVAVASCCGSAVLSQTCCPCCVQNWIIQEPTHTAEPCVILVLFECVRHTPLTLPPSLPTSKLDRYYDVTALKRDFGEITDYLPPAARHPSSIMNLSNTGGHGRGGQSGRVIGESIMIPWWQGLCDKVVAIAMQHVDCNM